MLHIREPSGVERTVPVIPEPIVLGRDDDCTVQLESPFVSRRHARIESGPGGAVLVDLGSHNGCLVNGERVEGSVPLRAGDVIAIADVTVECVGGAQRTIETRTLVRPEMSPPATGATATLSVRPPTAPPPVERAPAAEDLRIDARTLQVWLGERLLERRLSAQEFKLLSYLYDHQDRVCTRRELGDAVWGRYTWDPNLLYRLVRRVKEKVEPDPRRPRYLHTIPWVGYRLTPHPAEEPGAT